MSNVTVKHSDNYLPLTWKELKTTKGKKATVICKNGHIGNLANHNIAADGIVTPSVVCTGCDWHEHVKLEGWSP